MFARFPNFKHLYLCAHSTLHRRQQLTGEEFAIILATTSLTTATEIGYELVAGIAQHQHDIGQDHLPTITASIGIACNKEESFAQFIQRADTALFKAKEMGRNQVIAA